MTDIKDKYAEICQILARTAKESSLAIKPIHLLAASKQQSPLAIRQAYNAGIRHFGENRVQEAQEKWPELKAEWAHATLHLIGPLQTNKVKEAVALFDVIQTLDREKLAESLAKEMDKQKKQVPLFIQVNTGAEPQKAGVLPEAVDAFIARCRDYYKLPVIGLMCIPPAEDEPAPHFALLHEIAKRNKLDDLSMGMSEDFDIAARMGATYVRLGRILFGERA